MKFELSTTSRLCSSERKQALEGLGFKFIKSGSDHYIMEWRIEGSSTIELSTLEEFCSFVGKYGRVVVDGDKIEIYDDYRE